jgi:Ribbon-helix-helix protein, copG family
MTAKEKKQVTLNLTDAELEVLEELSRKKDLSKTAVLRQALRLYHMVDDKVSHGEKLYFEHDLTREKAQLMML